MNSLVAEHIPPAGTADEAASFSPITTIGEGAVPDGVEIYVAAILVVAYLALGGFRKGGFRGLLAL